MLTLCAFFLIIVTNLDVFETKLLYRPMKNYRLEDTPNLDVDSTADGCY